MDSETITITKEQLKLAFIDWEREHRSGGCLPYDENKRRPLLAVALEAADSMWHRLVQAKAAA